MTRALAESGASTMHSLSSGADDRANSVDRRIPCAARFVGGGNTRTLGDMSSVVSIRLERFSYRFAEQVLNSKLALKQEVEAILTSEAIELASLSRPKFNKVLRESFTAKGWHDQPHVFSDDEDLGAKMDFLKERVGIEVGFGHASFIGIDLLKFQVSSYSGLDQIDVGIYGTYPIFCV
jgi:Restriction endonuclease BglII